MIAPELVKKLKRLNREQRLEVIRFLKAELANEDCREWDNLISKPGQVFRNIGPIRVNFNEAGALLESLEEKSDGND